MTSESCALNRHNEIIVFACRWCAETWSILPLVFGWLMNCITQIDAKRRTNCQHFETRQSKAVIVIHCNLIEHEMCIVRTKIGVVSLSTRVLMKLQEILLYSLQFFSLRSSNASTMLHLCARKELWHWKSWRRSQQGQCSPWRQSPPFPSNQTLVHHIFPAIESIQPNEWVDFFIKLNFARESEMWHEMVSQEKNGFFLLVENFEKLYN